VTSCANNTSYPNFFGTSAAAPHAAAIAALMMQADSMLTPAQIYGALQSSALPMANTSPDVNTGYGFIQADTAYSSLGLGTPPVTVGANQSTTSKGGGGGAIDGIVLLVLGGLGLARLLQQRRALGRAHDRRTGDFVVPALSVVVDGNPDKTQTDYGER
jgi:subtilisin family serine protease